MMLLRGNLEGIEGLGRATSRLMLSTGVHPVVLEQPEKHALQWDEFYYSYRRPKKKSNNLVQGVWSAAMREPGVLDTIGSKLGRSKRWYLHCVVEAGKDAQLSGILNLNQLRSTMFVNRARLGHHILDISHSTSTSMPVIAQNYTFGMADRKRLTQSELDWLSWLMEG